MPERTVDPSALAVGGIAAFVVGVDLVRAARIEPLSDAEISWVIPRLALGLTVIAGAAAAGCAAAGAFWLWSRRRSAAEDLAPLPLPRRALTILFAAALLAGAVARFWALGERPPVVWVDEVLPVGPALALTGRLGDFRDAIRMLPADKPTTAFIGTLYLEAHALVLRTGVSQASLRVPGAIAGTLSLLTAALLARRLLPAGGATLTALALAGMRWPLIVERFGWNAIALAPLADVAAILAIEARRRRRGVWVALGSGVVAGIGAHVYLASWIVAAALGLFLAWPSGGAPGLGSRVRKAALFAAGFLLAVAPIFLLREGRAAPYFVRAGDQSLFKDLERGYSWLTVAGVAADSVKAPWLLPDPVRRQDLPKSRVGWVLGIPLATTMLLSVRSPGRDVSALLLCHAMAATAASVWWGFPGHPNGFRFLYLSTLTAVAVAAGILWMVARVRSPLRGAASIAACGLLAIAGSLGARDALDVWATSRETFDAYGGGATLVGRAAERWSCFGPVGLQPGLAGSRLVTRTVWEFSLGEPQPCGTATHERRRFRVLPPGRAPGGDERVVERIRDAWGREHGIVVVTPPTPS